MSQYNGPDTESPGAWASNLDIPGQMHQEPYKIGGVPYLVGAPALHGMEQRERVILTRKYPRILIEELRRGELEAALVSSIEGFRRPGYQALRSIGISCDGEVRSVRMFLRTAPEAVRSLALDCGSATSVALSKVLLAKRFGARLEHTFDIEPTCQPDEIDADAVLLIGDAGLRAECGQRRVLDLGAEWKAWKGLPFVFALWLIQTTEKRSAGIAEELTAAWARGKAAGIEDGTGGRIQYDLGARHHEGLQAFHAEAAELGHCESGLEPQWIADTNQVSS